MSTRPEPAAVLACSACGFPWAEHVTVAAERERAQRDLLMRVVDERAATVELVDCIEVLRSYTGGMLGPRLLPGPPGPMGPMGPIGMTGASGRNA